MDISEEANPWLWDDHPEEKKIQERILRAQGGLQALIKNEEDVEVEGLDSLDRDVIHSGSFCEEVG